MERCVGTSVPRLDGFAKVTGRTKYIDDMDIPACWFAAAVRSPIPYGKIKSITFDPKFDWTKVATCTAKDIPGKNAAIFMLEDQPILASEFVRHVGEAVAVIAAPTKELAIEAVGHVKVEYEELTPVFTIEESKALKNVIYGNDNIISKYKIEKGDIEAGFKEADLVVEGEYRTGFHEHAYIEPQGVAAIPREDGGLTVVGSLQCPYYVLKTLKAVLNMDETKVNVVQAPMGGAFGGKEDYPSIMGSYVALLALKAKKPVKMVYSRDEDILVTTKRHPSIVRHRTGVKRDGTVTAMQVDVEFNGGAYSTLSQVVLARGILHSAGVYKCENILCRAACYATNNVPTGAFRGFGAPQTLFAVESHMDMVAAKVGIDPMTLRLKNCVKLRDSLCTGQVMRESVSAEECLTAATKSSHFLKKWYQYKDQLGSARQLPSPLMGEGQGEGGSPPPLPPNNRRTGKGGGDQGKEHIRRGIGLALYMHGGAFTGSGEAIMKTEAALRLNKNGTVSVLTGCTEMGQGAHTVLPQIAADALGIPFEFVNTAVPDTAMVPDSGPTVASRTTMVIGRTIEKCAAKFKTELEKFVKSSPKLAKAPFGEVAKAYFEAKGELKVIERYELPSWVRWDAENFRGDAYPAYSWACDVAEVEVDTETFEVNVEKMTIAFDPGKAVNPVLLEGQMEGGTLQALGFGLMEEMVYKGGRPLNSRLQTYIIPTVQDTPSFQVHIVENPVSHGPQGAKGIGELPVDGGAPAIANAIYNAIGVRMTDLPITAEKLYENSLSPKGRGSG